MPSHSKPTKSADKSKSKKSSSNQDKKQYHHDVDCDTAFATPLDRYAYRTNKLIKAYDPPQGPPFIQISNLLFNLLEASDAVLMARLLSLYNFHRRANHLDRKGGFRASRNYINKIHRCSTGNQRRIMDRLIRRGFLEVYQHGKGCDRFVLINFKTFHAELKKVFSIGLAEDGSPLIQPGSKAARRCDSLRKKDLNLWE